jgi:hypothetical protein
VVAGAVEDGKYQPDHDEQDKKGEQEPEQMTGPERVAVGPWGHGHAIRPGARRLAGAIRPGGDEANERCEKNRGQNPEAASVSHFDLQVPAPCFIECRPGAPANLGMRLEPACEGVVNVRRRSDARIYIVK